MPASRSTKRSTNSEPRPARARATAVWILIVALAALAVFLSALPAGVATHFLPPNVHADDLSGSIWHGAMGKITVAGRDAGALEWRIYPAALLHLALKADLHWVHRGFGAEATATIDRGRATLSAIRGGGPIEDLQDFGVVRGWRGTTDIALDKLSTDMVRILSASGDVTVSGLSAAQLAAGADLGGYVLHLGADAVDANGVITGQLSDTGGPLKLQGAITVSPQQHNGTLSGTIRERNLVSEELRKELDSLAQLRGRDRNGNIPIDLEFTF